MDLVIHLNLGKKELHIECLGEAELSLPCDAAINGPIYQDEYISVIVSDDLKFGGSWKQYSDFASLDEKASSAVFRLLSIYWNLFTDEIVLPEKLITDHKRPRLEQDVEKVFYGGSFNPLHEGHLECLRQMQSKNVIVMPDNNPHKEERAEGHLFSDYLKVVELCKDYTPFIFPGFLVDTKSNPTWSWFSKVSGLKSLLIGADSFLNFKKWFEYEKLLASMHCLYIVPRDSDNTLVQSLISEFQSIYPDLKLEYLDHHQYEKLSSTELRNQILT